MARKCVRSIGNCIGKHIFKYNAFVKVSQNTEQDNDSFLNLIFNTINTTYGMNVTYEATYTQVDRSNITKKSEVKSRQPRGD